MNPTEATPDMIAKFLTHFKVMVETPAFQELSYDPANDRYSYGEPQMNDDTSSVSVYDRRADNNDDSDEYIEPMVSFHENGGEIMVTADLAFLFHESNYDIDAFLDAVGEEYN